MSDDPHVITGGLGSGKSSVIGALAARGFRCMPAIGGSALPWADCEAFAALMLGWEMRSHREAADTSVPIFSDRGIPDVVGYLRLCNLPVPTPVLRAAELCRYSLRVFIAPHSPDIFEQDAERKQGPAEAEATYHKMADAYSMLGYELVALPLSPVADRAEFVLSHIG